MATTRAKAKQPVEAKAIDASGPSLLQQDPNYDETEAFKVALANARTLIQHADPENNKPGKPTELEQMKRALQEAKNGSHCRLLQKANFALCIPLHEMSTPWERVVYMNSTRIITKKFPRLLDEIPAITLSICKKEIRYLHALGLTRGMFTSKAVWEQTTTKEELQNLGFSQEKFIDIVREILDTPAPEERKVLVRQSHYVDRMRNLLIYHDTLWGHILDELVGGNGQNIKDALTQRTVLFFQWWTLQYGTPFRNPTEKETAHINQLKILQAVTDTTRRGHEIVSVLLYSALLWYKVAAGLKNIPPWLEALATYMQLWVLRVTTMQWHVEKGEF